MLIRLLEHWALILLSSLTILLVALICETSWPVAYVYLLSVPGGADVFDGDGFYWTTPAWIPVSHRGLEVTVSHTGRLTRDTVLTPAMADSPVIISLPYMFTVHIGSDPPGASVMLDDRLAGTTPVSVTVPEPGVHIIRVTDGDQVLVTDSIMLLDNSPDSLNYLLPRPFGERMVLVPSGPGSLSELDHSFLMARREVTNSEFCQYLDWLEPAPVRDTTNRWGRTDVLESMFPGDYPLPFMIGPRGKWTVQTGMEDHPVFGITLQAAMDYCIWYTAFRDDGLHYRLPTPDEWKTAALAGSGGPWPWGDRRPDGTLLNLSDTNEVLLRRHPSIDDGFKETAPVGSYPPNGWGLYDMAGNLWEYCLPADGETPPVAMGGSWLSSMEDCESDAMLLPDTVLGYPYIGFRLAATAGFIP